MREESTGSGERSRREGEKGRVVEGREEGREKRR
jgi:hypothetical protein